MIRVQGVSKKFKIYATPADRLKEKLLRRPCHHEYAALSDISFEVQPGETLGIIGENGAGKSTLLKILSGVLLPDTGSVEVTGKVTGLLELGTGFNPELTGLQNIFMNGTFLGMTHDEIESKKDTIIEFAELGDFINEPIKTYSSGMLMRLGFAIAIHADPECFLVDEALSVGDAYFQQKCMRKIQEFKEQGGSIIFVSHDMNAIMSLSNYAIWLEAGVIMMKGGVRRVVDSYWTKVIDQMNSDNSQKKIEELSNEIVGRTTGDIICKGIKIQNMSGEEIVQALSGERIQIEVDYFAQEEILNPDYGIQIRDKNGISVFGVNFAGKKIKEDIHNKNCIKKIKYIIDLNLTPGEYFLSLGVGNNVIRAEACQFENYLYNAWDVKKIDIILNKSLPMYYGLTNLENRIEVIDV